MQCQCLSNLDRVDGLDRVQCHLRGRFKDQGRHAAKYYNCEAYCNQVRECTLPKERIAGCQGEDKVTEDCNSDSCPSLTPWSEWSECSSSCGGGTRSKKRQCVYPRDAANNDCLEQLEMSESCNDQVCPAYTEWTEWTECTKTCGGGVRKKVRECTLPSTRGVSGCENQGEPEAEEECNTQRCPAWTEWTDWTPCTKTCGGGGQRRERACVLAREVGSLFCPGPGDEERECNPQVCPVWTEWAEWTPCTKTCGGGQKTQRRECVLPKVGDQLGCEGDPIREMECSTEVCPVWTEWTDWTECSATCGGGSRTKVRECVLPRDGGTEGQCPGDGEATEECNSQTCPDWTDWSEWTPCTETCGGGQRKRSRQCVARRDGGDSCQGDDEEVEECNGQNCPSFSEWTDWTSCSKSCGGGERSRERHCQVRQVLASF